MKRSGPLRRTAMKRTRKRLPPMSTKRRAEAQGHAAIREAVFRRDGHRCRLLDLDPSHRCHGPLTPHHVQKASQGGAYTLANLVTLCSFANTWVEDHPAEARALGLVRLSWE